eukprot:TRINITY_DN5233_c3_g6_i1.p1 TRINITY_DN5233_c3_g6~~TRINITY_DN5233_c3_g6_i1.p1  ORF type:complete len:102 (-),score=16.02 TRINITY_DN5233_c3_g6_i1:213-518(-)
MQRYVGQEKQIRIQKQKQKQKILEKERGWKNEKAGTRNRPTGDWQRRVALKKKPPNLHFLSQSTETGHVNCSKRQEEQRAEGRKNKKNTPQKKGNANGVWF